MEFVKVVSIICYKEKIPDADRAVTGASGGVVTTLTGYDKNELYLHNDSTEDSRDGDLPDRIYKKLLIDNMDHFLTDEEDVCPTFIIIHELWNRLKNYGDERHSISVAFQYNPAKKLFEKADMWGERDGKKAFHLRSDASMRRVLTPQEVRQRFLDTIRSVPDKDFARLKQLRREGRLVNLDEDEVDPDYDGDIVHTQSAAIYALYDVMRAYIDAYAADADSYEDVLGEAAHYRHSLGVIYQGRKALKEMARLEGENLLTFFLNAMRLEQTASWD